MFEGVNAEREQCRRYCSSGKRELLEGRLSGSAVECLPLAQGVILGSGIESLIGLPVRSLLLPLPVSLPLTVSLMNK